ncbi:MAG: haloacid dehalogenase-like hydrolase [Clostridia bacterium]|nr:haloacid dehalogenase-like hydrolase [Clostridia bacterium]
MSGPVIALMYDFDKTLSTRDMQDYGFIPELGLSPDEFWGEVDRLTDTQHMDSILAYMFLMVQKCGEKNIRITRDKFFELGRGIEYFEGVESWFGRINAAAAETGVNVEHYIVSSGIKEIIEGTSIARAGNFKRIYACEFMYDENGSIRWPKVAVNYTAKTQFLFRINKGVLDIDSKSAALLNKYTPENARRVPFGNMIYVGDGITDVPCMRLVKAYGGQSIAVYNEKKGDNTAKYLLSSGRVNYCVPADFTAGSLIEKIVCTVMKKIKAVSDMESF